jgi:hypothetical protein
MGSQKITGGRRTSPASTALNELFGQVQVQAFIKSKHAASEPCQPWAGTPIIGQTTTDHFLMIAAS